MLDTIAAYWDDRAASFDEEADHGLTVPATREAWARRLTSWLPHPPAEIADLGCGTGTLAVLLASRGYRVTASDLSPEMVERARAKADRANVDIAVTVADAAAPDDLPPGSADAVLVRHLAWTLPDPEEAIATWASLLRGTGRLVMVEGRWRTPAQEHLSRETEDVDHGDYAPVYRELPWYGGVGADTLVPVVERTFRRVELHDLTGEQALWGRTVTDERYAVVAHLD